MSTNKILDAALELREEGFAIHWLLPKTKKPFEDDWTKLPVKSTEVLKRQYRDNYNAGVRLGKPSKIGNSFLHVIDFDVRDVRKLDEAQKALDEILGDIKKEDLSYVISGSGGESRHYYLLLDTPLNSKKLARTKEKIILEDGTEHLKWEIDLFGTGKQVVIPPSVHPSGGIYSWGKPFISDFEQTYSSEIFEKAYQRSENEDIDPDAVVLTNLGRRMNLSFEQAWDDLLNLDEDEWDHYDEWNKIGMACHFEFNGSEEGYRLFRDYSRQCKRHYFDKNGNPKPKEITEKDLAELDPFLEKKWHSYRRDIEKSEIVTWATIKKSISKIDKVAKFSKKLDKIENFKDAIEEAVSMEADEISYSVISKLIRNKFTDFTLVDIKKFISNGLKNSTKVEKIKHGKTTIDFRIANEIISSLYTKNKKVVLKYFNKTFWLYEEGLYRPVEDSYIEGVVSRIIEKVLNNNNKYISEQLSELIKSGDDKYSDTLISMTMRRLKNKTSMDGGSDPLGFAKPATESVFNFKNCEVVVEESGITIRDHNPDNPNLSRLDCEYNPEAKAPKYEKALFDYWGHYTDFADVKEDWLAFKGYLMQSERWLELFAMMIGKGRNGKSAMTRITTGIIGFDSVLSMEICRFGENNNHAFAGLVGKKLLLDADFPTYGYLPESMLKKLEGAILTANPKHVKEYNFYNQAVALICSNTFPRTKDHSEGFRRRPQIFKFDRVFSEDEVDPHLVRDILATEKSGIVNLCIEAYQRLKQRGHFINSKSRQEAFNEWERNASMFSKFVQEQVIKDPNGKVKIKDAWESYKEYSGFNDRIVKENKSTFESNMLGLNYVGFNEDWKGFRYFTGIQIKDNIKEFDFDDLDDDDEI